MFTTAHFQGHQGPRELSFRTWCGIYAFDYVVNIDAESSLSLRQARIQHDKEEVFEQAHGHWQQGKQHVNPEKEILICGNAAVK